MGQPENKVTVAHIHHEEGMGIGLFNIIRLGKANDSTANHQDIFQDVARSRCCSADVEFESNLRHSEVPFWHEAIQHERLRVIEGPWRQWLQRGKATDKAQCCEWWGKSQSVNRA